MLEQKVQISDHDEQEDVHHEDENTSKHAMKDEPKYHEMYEVGKPATKIEALFGEPYHVKDEFAAHKITWRFMLVLMAVYLVQGSRDVLVISMQYYTTAIWNIGPADFQRMMAITSIPWTIKIIYGLIIDALPICGYKRKIYLVLFGVIGVISMLMAILYGATSYKLHLICLTLNQVCVAFSDVIADAMTVERTEFKSHSVATRLQALAWASRTVSSIVGILIGTKLQESGEPKDILKVYWMYCVIAMTIPILGLVLPEKRIKKHNGSSSETQHVQTHSVYKIFKLTLQTLSRKRIFYPLLFLFTLNCTPMAAEPLNYFFIYELGFTSVQFGYLSTVGSVAFLMAIIIVTIQSRRSNDSFSLRASFLIWTLIAGILPFSILILIFHLNQRIGFPNFAFVVSDTIIIKTAVSIQVMLMLILMARICPPGIEGFFMTVLTSIVNASGTVSLQISSHIVEGLGIECVEDEIDQNEVVCNFDNLWLMVVIVNLTTFLPLLFISTIPNEKQLSELTEQLEQASVDNERVPERAEMVGLYWLVNDHVYPMLCSCESNANGMSSKRQYENVVPGDDEEDGGNTRGNEEEEQEMAALKDL